MTDERINSLTLEEKSFGDYSSGRFAWLFEDAVMFKDFFVARGSMHLWNCPLMIKKEILELNTHNGSSPT